MRARALAVTFSGLLVHLCGVAQAHFILSQPPSALSTEDGGKGRPPCGEGVPSGIVTKVKGGTPLSIRLVEFVPHPGHYRVALSINSRDELPPDPEVVVDARGLSVRAAIQIFPSFPILADGMFAHTDASTVRTWQGEVMLPNINCAHCTLQVIEFMAQHEFNPGGGFFYHHCADLQITATATDGFLPGEILVGGRPPYQFDFGAGFIQARDVTGAFLRDAAVLPVGHPRDAVMVGSDVLFSDSRGIQRMQPDGTVSPFAAGDDAGRPYSAMAIDGQGFVYVANLGTTIRRIGPNGAVVSSFVVPGDQPAAQVGSMDLAADQCTLVYSTGGIHVKRFDVCRVVPLSDLVSLNAGGSVNGLRILADNTVLAATASNGILHLSSSGAVLKTYGANPNDYWMSLSVSPDQRMFWAGGGIGVSGVAIMKFDLDTGAELSGPIPIPVPTVPSLSLTPEFILQVGERRVAQSTSPGSNRRRVVH